MPPLPVEFGMSQPWVQPTTLSGAGGVRLDPLERRHAPDLFEAADVDLFRHSLQSPAEWSVRGFERDVDMVNGLPGVVAYAIVLEKTGRTVGRTTFMDIRPEHRGLEIGRTWIGRSHHGTRVNPAAKYLMLRHAFESLSPPAVRVQLTTNITNLHSQRAIEKLGAAREGVHRKARILPPGGGRTEAVVRDWVCYSIVDDEWARVKAGLEARLAAL